MNISHLQHVPECIQACTLDERYDRIAGCAYICEMTHGYENKEFLDTIGCLIDNKCLDDYPNDGVCLGEDKDGMENIQTLEQVKDMDIPFFIEQFYIISVFYA